jgi:hypothetical protein
LVGLIVRQNENDRVSQSQNVLIRKLVSEPIEPHGTVKRNFSEPIVAKEHYGIDNPEDLQRTLSRKNSFGRLFFYKLFIAFSTKICL